MRGDVIGALSDRADCATAGSNGWRGYCEQFDLTS